MLVLAFCSLPDSAEWPVFFLAGYRVIAAINNPPGKGDVITLGLVFYNLGW
jgi:hypothetical protein